MKRIFDVVLSIALFPVALFVCLLAAPFIWFDTKANPLFRQVRIGLNGRPFTILKLRTMSADTINVASHQVPIGQITPLGRMIRRTKIDELPQLWNVLRGDMSIVGPRPCLPNQTELVDARNVAGVFAIRPGVTGLAQCEAIDMSDPEKLVAVDARYIRTQSVYGDMRIIWRTLSGNGGGDAAQKR